MDQTMERFGRYEIVGELGWGGFASVYRAWDPTLGREVALKALLPHLAAVPEIRQRFLSEARAIASLRHPNIVQFYEVGEANGRPFFTMELIDGPSLAALLSSGEGLPYEEALGIVRSLASALDYLHGAGLVHRDIKAANVMLDRTGRAVLMDFGIVRNLDVTQHTRTGATLGSTETMAPEQVRGEPVGPATDIYALGIVTYQLLAGQPPFVGDTAYVLYAQAHELPPPLWQTRPGLPGAVYSAVDWALAKDPAARPATARLFVEALTGEGEHHVPDPPRTTATETTVQPGLKPGFIDGLRRRAGAITMSACALALLALVAVFVVRLESGHAQPVTGRVPAGTGSLFGRAEKTAAATATGTRQNGTKTPAGGAGAKPTAVPAPAQPLTVKAEDVESQASVVDVQHDLEFLLQRFQEDYGITPNQPITVYLAMDPDAAMKRLAKFGIKKDEAQNVLLTHPLQPNKNATNTYEDLVYLHNTKTPGTFQFTLATIASYSAFAQTMPHPYWFELGFARYQATFVPGASDPLTLRAAGAVKAGAAPSLAGISTDDEVQAFESSHKQGAILVNAISEAAVRYIAQQHGEAAVGRLLRGDAQNASGSVEQFDVLLQQITKMNIDDFNTAVDHSLQP